MASRLRHWHSRLRRSFSAAPTKNAVDVISKCNLQDMFVCFVALRPKSTAMVMAGRSVHLATLFPGQA